ncbi:chromate transporter [Bacillus sp. Marseille-P3661]|uniref:chromate transporter n=1 Tax=Bacillus sp. Marseille-P3661 TaxID=1936234 RepID=UPI001C63E5F1|nr:chromate transporter [Bacillus sp. Marseille-P3661]
MNKDIRLLFEIFISFLKIGPVTFGGGYAMIPLIEREVVTKKKWLKIEDVSDVFALAESVPGAIAINSATFIGHRIAGTRGAICAMFGVLLPTFFTVITLSMLFFSLQGNPHLESAFMGIRASIVALIVFAGIKISKTAIFDKSTFALMAVMLIILLFVHIHPVMIIISGAILGVGIIKLKEKLGFVIKLDKEHQGYMNKDQEGA